MSFAVLAVTFCICKLVEAFMFSLFTVIFRLLFWARPCVILETSNRQAGAGDVSTWTKSLQGH